MRGRGEPACHQVEELPPIHVSGDRAPLPARALPGLRRRPRGGCPPAWRHSSFGPRFHAAVGVPSVATGSRAAMSSNRASSCSTRGSLPARSTRSSNASRRARDPRRPARARPCASALDMDETGWRSAGQRRALWGAFTHAPRRLRIASDRQRRARPVLLADTRAIVTSDRWWAYGHPPRRTPPDLLGAPAARLQSPTPRAGHREGFGEAGLRICDELFWASEIFQHTSDRRELKRRVRALPRVRAAPAHPRGRGTALGRSSVPRVEVRVDGTGLSSRGAPRCCRWRPSGWG